MSFTIGVPEPGTVTEVTLDEYRQMPLPPIVMEADDFEDGPVYYHADDDRAVAALFPLDTEDDLVVLTELSEDEREAIWDDIDAHEVEMLRMGVVLAGAYDFHLPGQHDQKTHGHGGGGGAQESPRDEGSEAEGATVRGKAMRMLGDEEGIYDPHEMEAAYERLPAAERQRRYNRAARVRRARMTKAKAKVDKPGGKFIKENPRKADAWDAPYVVDEEVRATVKEAYEGRYPDGFRTKVDRIEAFEDGIYVNGTIFKGRQKVGGFARSISDDGSVHHDLMQLSRSAQGAGFAREFNAHAEDVYRANGITEIELEADIDVGGYAWAKAGYQWDYDVGNPPTDHIRSRLDDLMADPDFPAPLRAEAKKLKNRIPNRDQYSSRSLSAAERRRMPSPQEIAAFGLDHSRTNARGHTIWPGKDLLMGSDWYGVKEL